MELTLIRHAKAEHFGQTDHKRQLSEDGLRQARELGKQLKSIIKPQILLHSNSLRTTQTAAEMSFDCPYVSLKKIYEADMMDILNLVNEVSEINEVKKIVVVGHEPIISITTNYLIGIDKDIGSTPTGTAYILSGNLNQNEMTLVQKVHVSARNST